MHTNKWYWPEAGPWLLLLTGGIAACWLQLHYHNLIGLDWLSYVNVAELYALGMFQKAINGYWSPLYSWIIALFIKLGERPHVTSYGISFAAATACFYFLQRLGRRYLKNILVYILFQLSVVIMLLYYTISELTPDLMGAAATLWFLTILSSPRFHTSYRLPVWAGIAAAMMFLAKSYNFFFLHMLFFVLLADALRSAAERSERRYRATGIALLVFWCVSLLWIIPLSIHEGKPAFSTAGRYSRNYAGPGHPGHLILRKVIAPPFEEAYTAWFNASNQLDDHPWSPFAGVDNVLYLLRHMADNTLVVVKILNGWYIRLDILLVCIALLAWYDKKRLYEAGRRLKLWLWVLLIYPVGYLPLFVEGRYIYIEGLLILFLFFYLLQEIGYRFSTNVKRKSLFDILIGTAIVVFLGFQSFVFGRQKVWMYQKARYFTTVENRLPYLQNKRIVSDKSYYLLATQFCYTMHARLYGVWSPKEYDKVKQYQVEYLLTGTPRQEAFLRLRELLPGRNGPLYLYQFVF